MLGVSGLAKGIGDAGQVIVGVLGALLSTIHFSGNLPESAPLLMVGGTHGIGESGGAVGQVGILICEGGDAF
ncbi:hypothetical protein LG331_03010 [Vreelandella aquamarina]|uniref:hypothetical protein n=1 Tax=Vreelandella aquamarina TaxID=77097 RepID=UPI00384F55CB